MPDSHGAEPEHNMCESLVLFIKMNYEEVNKTARCDAIHMTLVYLRNKVFRDTTVSKKGPPPQIQFKQEMPTSSHTQPPPTPRKEWQRK